MKQKRTVTDKAIDNAIASVKMEGFSFSPRHEKLCRDVVTGKLSKQDCIKQILSDTRSK